MGLFDSVMELLGMGDAPPARDLSLGDADAARYMAAVRKANFSGVDAEVGAMRDGAWDDRDFLTEIVAEQALEGLQGSEQILDAWCNNAPDSAIAHLLKGRHLMFWAWQARGGGTSDTVDDRSQDLFAERLGLAEAALRKAAELEPGDPCPWASLISVRLRGLDGDNEEGHALFTEVAGRDPLNRTAHMQMVMSLAHKWSGTGHGPMFGFARNAAVEAPVGSDVPACLIQAHIERWLWDYMFEDDDEAAEAYLEDPDVRAEALEAYERSLGSPEHRPRRSTIHFRNWAAMWFFLIKDRERLARELQHIGKAHTVAPWCYLDDEDLAFAEARAFAEGR